MDSSVGYRPCRPCTPQHSTHCQFHQYKHHHHHHHFYVSPNCPLHSYLLHFKNHHSPTAPAFASPHPQSQNPESLASVLHPNPFNLQLFESKESSFDNTPGVMDKENQELEEEEQQLEEEEEDPVFVLTDEWRELFAKSEAKRRLAKNQARKKGKNRMEQ